MEKSDCFSASYGEARAKFRDAATAAGARLEAVEHPEPGPGGERLFADVAQIGKSSANAAIVLISGTHGVEGFCGSGAQIDLLRRGEAQLAAHDLNVLLIHAINPYGFAWLRRVTHENIDLNRNWIDHNELAPPNPGYDALSEAIVPREWTDETRARAQIEFDTFEAREGLSALHQAIAGGQYNHPLGIFYGGRAPAWSRLTQTAILQSYLSAARHVAILDYHTGLGPRGFCELISTEPVESERFRRARDWFGASIKSTCAGTAAAARIAGDGLSAAGALLPHARVTGVALEFGTLERPAVRLALRADAWLHAYGDLASPLASDIKCQIRDAYYCNDADWKGMVLGQSLLTWRGAIAGLRETKRVTAGA